MGACNTTEKNPNVEFSRRCTAGLWPCAAERCTGGERYDRSIGNLYGGKMYDRSIGDLFGGKEYDRSVGNLYGGKAYD
jgi:hypothetical protein